MAFYENVFIARQDVSATQVDALAEAFSAIIAANGGSVKKKEYWGLRTLTYRIRKNRKGHYVLLNLDAPSAAVLEMERNMRINEDVLRYLTVRVETLEEGPSAMMQSKGSRDDRGPRDDRGFRDDRGHREDRPRRRDSESGENRVEAGMAAEKGDVS
ncbi:MAG: 30S ribosomal protein S6 [Rhodospirillaceae bacterium]|nr:30S ribosomal protein S6 [Rhodospirillaceae bacterium]